MKNNQPASSSFELIQRGVKRAEGKAKRWCEMCLNHLKLLSFTLPAALCFVHITWIHFQSIGELKREREVNNKWSFFFIRFCFRDKSAMPLQQPVDLFINLARRRGKKGKICENFEICHIKSSLSSVWKSTNLLSPKYSIFGEWWIFCK